MELIALIANRIGLDVVPISRIRDSLVSYGPAFRRKVLTPKESSYCQGPREVEKVAGRIAAKEAIMKVLGDGWPSVPWTSIEVLPDESGRPCATLSGRALAILVDLKLSGIDVSITHDAGLAIAVALGIGTNPVEEK